MSSLNAIASSGLSAARMRLDASAGNVANMNTPGYRAQRVVQQARDAAQLQEHFGRGSGLDRTL